MKESDHIEHVNEEILARFLSGEASEPEKAMVESWIGRSAENAAVFRSCSDLMQKAKLYYHSRKFDTAAAWEKVEREIRLLERRFDKRIEALRHLVATGKTSRDAAAQTCAALGHITQEELLDIERILTSNDLRIARRNIQLLDMP